MPALAARERPDEPPLDELSSSPFLSFSSLFESSLDCSEPPPPAADDVVGGDVVAAEADVLVVSVGAEVCRSKHSLVSGNLVLLTHHCLPFRC